MPAVERACRATWSRVAARCPGFEVVVPGDRSFVCQADACGRHCCRLIGIVPLGERELRRLIATSGLGPLAIVECEGGRPASHPFLPAGRPYFLARRDGVCRFLGPDLLCAEHAGRPDACRMYPYSVFFFDPADGAPLRLVWPAMRSAVARLVAGSARPAESEPAALLLRHSACPGATGPPLTLAAWRELVEATFVLQYGDGPAVPGA